MIKKLNSLMSLESLKSIKLPKSFYSFRSRTLTFDKTKAAKAASSVVLFGFSGWFLWNTFLATPEPTLPPSLPQAVATINPMSVPQAPFPAVEPVVTQEHVTLSESDEITDELLVVTDSHEQADDVQNQIPQDTQQVLTETHDSIDQQLAALCVTADSCADNPVPETITKTKTLVEDATPQKNNQFTLTARSNLDARECLDLTENMAIHRCAENFR